MKAPVRDNAAAQGRLSHRQRRRRGEQKPCPLCREERRFFWACPCGFVICDRCMEQDSWGFTCNHITWVCPDCGEIRSY